MAFLVYIRRNETREVRCCREFTGDARWCEWDGEYMWADGNYSCDCNRELFFDRAGGDAGEGPHACTDGQYSVMITDMAGKLLYADGDWGRRGKLLEESE